MTRAASPLDALGRAATAERLPPRPDTGRLALRLALAACLALVWLVPPLLRWADAARGDQALAPVASALRQALAPQISAFATLGAAFGLTLAAVELAAAALQLARQRRALDRAGLAYLRVRSLRPQSRASAPTGDPAELWRALHVALQTPGQAGPRPWAAFTLHARPDQPAALGVAVAGNDGPRRSLARALTKTLQGQDAELVVDARPDPLAAALAPGRLVLWQELLLARPPHAPIRSSDEFQADPIGPLAAALRTPPGVAHVEVQVIARPRGDIDLATAWRASARRKLALLRRRDAFGAARETQALQRKLDSECYDVSLRLVAVAEGPANRAAALAALRELRAALGQYQSRGAGGLQRFRAAGPVTTHSLVVPRQGCSPRLARVANRTPRIVPPSNLVLPAPAWAAPPILSGAELGGLWRLPGVELKTLLAWLPNRHLPAQQHAFVPPGATDRVVLGRAPRGDGVEAPVGPTLQALRQVLHLTAGMGAGKSRALANMACQLVPRGFFLLDGKGDDLNGGLAAAARTYIPLADEERLIILDVLDAAWPLGLNPLHGIDAAQPGGLTQAIGTVLAVFARLDPETWGKSLGMQQYAQMAAALVAEVEPQPTLANLKQAIEDEGYRARLLPRCANVEVRTFWETTFRQLGDQQKSSRDALLRRLDALMVDETTRYLVSQPRPTVDLLAAMERGRIVVAPLPHRTLGGMAEFVGMLLLQAIVRAAFRRPGDERTRATVPLIVDELQVFLGGGESRDLADAITQLRSFGVAGVYAHQTLGQLGDLRDDMLNNSANRLILRTQEPDASAYAAQYPTTDLTAADVMGQHWHEHQYAIFGGGDGPPEVCSIRPLPWPAPLEVENDVPPYHGPPWQALLPAPDGPLAPAEQNNAPLEALIAGLVYGEAGPRNVAEQLARLPEREWAYLHERWDAIRAYQRRFIIANPGCVAPEGPDGRRVARQRWLSRLETRTPRVLAEAAYLRQRWTVAP